MGGVTLLLNTRGLGFSRQVEISKELISSPGSHCLFCLTETIEAADFSSVRKKIRKDFKIGTQK